MRILSVPLLLWAAYVVLIIPGSARDYPGVLGFRVTVAVAVYGGLLFLIGDRFADRGAVAIALPAVALVIALLVGCATFLVKTLDPGAGPVTEIERAALRVVLATLFVYSRPGPQYR